MKDCLLLLASKSLPHRDSCSLTHSKGFPIKKVLTFRIVTWLMVFKNVFLTFVPNILKKMCSMARKLVLIIQWLITCSDFV